MVADVDTVVLTHMHGDHLDGAVHIRRPVLVHDSELRFSRTRGARMMQRVLRQPIPALRTRAQSHRDALMRLWPRWGQR